MEKAMIGKMPAGAFPAVIAGSMVDGKPTFNTLGCYGLISPYPPTVYIKSIKPHYTNIGIRKTGYFSVNIPARDLTEKTDYVGLVSGKDTDKSGVFTTFFGSSDKAPLIEECQVNILCRVVQTVYMPTQPNTEIFIGEVEEVYVNKKCMTDGVPDLNKILPLMLSGTQYMEISGKPTGVMYETGKALIKK